jgi:hypothetical protein
MAVITVDQNDLRFLFTAKLMPEAGCQLQSACAAANYHNFLDW